MSNAIRIGFNVLSAQASPETVLVVSSCKEDDAAATRGASAIVPPPLRWMSHAKEHKGPSDPALWRPHPLRSPLSGPDVG